MAVSAKYDEFNHWWATEGDWVEEPNYLWGSDQFWAEFVQPGRTCKPCVARGVVI